MSKLRSFITAKLDAFAFGEVSSRPIALFRILTCLVIIYELCVPWIGHKMNDRPATLLLSWVVFAATSLLLVGYRTRWTSIILMVSFAIMHLYFGRHIGGVAWLSKPIQLFQSVTILAIAPSGRSLSIDRAREVRAARAEGREPEAERMPAWILDVLALQLVALYFWPGRDKTDAAWLGGERMEHYYMEWYGGSDSLVYTPWYHTFAVIMAWATTTLELTLSVGMIFRRSRPYVVWGGIMLHLGILFTLSVTYFQMTMLAALFACMSPPGIHRFFSRITQDSKPDSKPESKATPYSAADSSSLAAGSAGS